MPYIEGLIYGDIDLREARELMPDNPYWLLGSPTKDEAVLAARKEESKRRNEMKSTGACWRVMPAKKKCTPTTITAGRYPAGWS